MTVWQEDELTCRYASTSLTPGILLGGKADRLQRLRGSGAESFHEWAEWHEEDTHPSRRKPESKRWGEWESACCRLYLLYNLTLSNPNILYWQEVTVTQILSGVVEPSSLCRETCLLVIINWTSCVSLLEWRSRHILRATRHPQTIEFEFLTDSQTMTQRFPGNSSCLNTEFRVKNGMMFCFCGSR